MANIRISPSVAFKPRKANPMRTDLETEIYNQKTYSNEIKELKFLVETGKADPFTIDMYGALLQGRKITPKMLKCIKRIIHENSPEQVEKKRLETERLLLKLIKVKNVFEKCEYKPTYVWRTEDFLDSLEKQILKKGSLSVRQKIAMNDMYKRFKKKSEKNT